jgi:hypothetical protein
MGTQAPDVITSSGNGHDPDPSRHHIATQQIVRAELLIVVLIESSLGYNHLGDW